MSNLLDIVSSVSTFLHLTFAMVSGSEDLPCIPKKYKESTVCVCNSTYCDTIGDLPPLADGQYVLYTSNMDGLRFSRNYGSVKKSTKAPVDFDLKEASTLPSFFRRTLDLDLLGSSDIYLNELKRYQTIIGFGGAVTDAVGINLQKLSVKTQDNLLRSYFGPKGIEYNMVRVPIGGSDFSTRPYAYNELPVGDTKLNNFSLAMEDLEYKIPIIQKARSLSREEVLVLGTVWSPPPWMKTNNAYSGTGRLKPEYYQTYADYYLKFIQQYEQRDISIWGITTGNEPQNYMLPLIPFNSLGFKPSDHADWIVNNLGPTIKKHGDIKILAAGGQRVSLPWWIILMENHSPRVMDYIDGIGVHWYFDYLPTSLITWTHDLYPNKFILSTEACEGSMPNYTNDLLGLVDVSLGSWERAENYADNIIENLNHDIAGWLDWNIALDENGGPNYVKNFVDSPIIVMPKNNQFYKQPMFYAVGHFSKFIPRGSVRIDLVQKTSGVDSVAFKRPDGYIVVVLLNRNNAGRNIKIATNKNTQVVLKLTRKSITTMILNL